MENSQLFKVFSSKSKENKKYRYFTDFVREVITKHNVYYVAFVHMPVHSQTPCVPRCFCYDWRFFYDTMKHIGYIGFVEWNI